MNNMYVMDKDYCPKCDTIIMQGLCSDCEYYKGFEIKDGQRCIVCTFYSEASINEENRGEQEK